MCSAVQGPLQYVKGHIGAGYDINCMYAGKKWSTLPRFTPLAAVVEAGSIPAVSTATATAIAVYSTDGAGM